MPEKAQELAQFTHAKKDQLMGAVQKAKQTIIGSGTIKNRIESMPSTLLEKTKNLVIGSGSLATEKERAKTSYLGNANESGIYGNIVKTPFKAAKELLTLHPLNATREMVKGTLGVLSKSLDAVFAPTRLAYAGGKSADIKGKAIKTKNAVINTASKASPFYLWNTMDRGVEGINKLAGKAWGTLDKGLDKAIAAGKAA